MEIPSLGLSARQRLTRLCSLASSAAFLDKDLVLADLKKSLNKSTGELRGIGGTGSGETGDSCCCG